VEKLERSLSREVDVDRTGLAGCRLSREGAGRSEVGLGRAEAGLGMPEAGRACGRRESRGMALEGARVWESSMARWKLPRERANEASRIPSAVQVVF
jgi:hypothetical protein